MGLSVSGREQVKNEAERSLRAVILSGSLQEHSTVVFLPPFFNFRTHTLADSNGLSWLGQPTGYLQAITPFSKPSLN